REVYYAGGARFNSGCVHTDESRMCFFFANYELANVGIEPKTFALLARRSNQLS
ncbi:hypothetical protein E4T56_gene5240, partial [Termitomyces sp. T112]